MSEKTPLTPADYLARGILTGAAVGVFGALITGRSLFWCAGIGMIGGFFAGLTMSKLVKNKKK